MIRVTIELESVITGKTKVIGIMSIWNRGINSAVLSGNKPGRFNYMTAVHRRGTPKTEFASAPEDKNVTRFGYMNDYPAASYNVWRLVIRALRSAFPEEK